MMRAAAKVPGASGHDFHPSQKADELRFCDCRQRCCRWELLGEGECGVWWEHEGFPQIVSDSRIVEFACAVQFTVTAFNSLKRCGGALRSSYRAGELQLALTTWHAWGTLL